MITLFRMGSSILAFSLGIIVSGGVFSFIAMIGIIPRLAQKTKTKAFIRYYEDVIVIAGIAGASTLVFRYELNVPKGLIWICALCGGIFLGCLAVSITEVLDVIPIVARRANVLSSIKYFIISLAIGKCIGTFIYYYLKLY